jgi:hypothetical protein
VGNSDHKLLELEDEEPITLQVHIRTKLTA